VPQLGNQTAISFSHKKETQREGSQQPLQEKESTAPSNIEKLHNTTSSFLKKKKTKRKLLVVKKSSITLYAPTQMTKPNKLVEQNQNLPTTSSEGTSASFKTVTIFFTSEIVPFCTRK
jgi:hypothetical protein